MVDLRKFIKAHTHKGLGRALAKLALELNMYQTDLRTRRKLKRLSSCTGNMKFNMGCASHVKEGWVNIDLFDKDCINLDLRERLPFPDGIASVIYSVHFLEHLSFPDDVRMFLHECFRILQPGGLFRVGVPDAQILLETYCRRRDVKDFKVRATLPENPTRMQIVNVMFKHFGHQYMYDYETLRKILLDVGFVDVSKRSFDPSLDHEHRRDWTLYVNAYKPSQAVVS